MTKIYNEILKLSASKDIFKHKNVFPNDPNEKFLKYKNAFKTLEDLELAEELEGGNARITPLGLEVYNGIGIVNFLENHENKKQRQIEKDDIEFKNLK